MDGLMYFEFIQKAHNGGFPLDNKSANHVGFAHGDSVVVLQKRQLLSMFYQMRSFMLSNVDDLGFTTEEQELLDTIEDFCSKEDCFMARGPDLPEQSLLKSKKRKSNSPKVE